MHLSERAIEYPRLVLVGAVLFCAVGLAAMWSLPKERTPRVRLPVVIVGIANPGSSPADNETQIVRRIEKESGTLKGLKSEGGLISEAGQGGAVVQFVFDDSVDVLEARRDVESLINRVKGEFPERARSDPGPIVKDIAFEDWPIIQVFLAGGESGHGRKRVADRLSERIEKLPGVAGVDLFGGEEREVLVEVDPHRMTLYGFSYLHVEEALRRASQTAPGGALESGAGVDQRVRTRAVMDTVSDIASIPLGQRDGKQVLVGDIGTVRLQDKSAASLARYDGREAVVLLVRGRTDIDVLRTADAVQAVVDEFGAAGQAQGMELGTVRSQAREVRFMLSNLGQNAWQGALLVVLLLWVAMGWRNALLVSVSIPFSLLGMAGLMWVAKHTVAPELAINIMTLFATTLVMGMVVDGCIVVAENIYRHREMGRSPREAARRGIREVGGAVVSAYLTTFASFAPLFMVRGMVGDYLELLPVAVILALCSAMIADHYILPLVSVWLMRSPRKVTPPPRSPDGRELTPEEVEVRNVRALVAENRLLRWYGRGLESLLPRRRLVLVLAVAAALLPVALWRSGAIGFEFFPESDMPMIEVHYELPLGSSMTGRTVAVGKEIERAVLRAVRPEEWYEPPRALLPDGRRAQGRLVRPVTTIGDPGALSTKIDSESGVGPEFGMVYVELKLAWDRQRSAAEIRRAIEAALPPLPGVIVRVRSPSEGPPSGAPVAVRVLAESDTTVDRLALRAREVEERMRGVPGLRDVSSDHREQPEFRVSPDHALARFFDLDTATINASVRYALSGGKVAEVDFGGDQTLDITLRGRLEDRDDEEDLRNLPLLSASGRQSVLGQVAEVELRQSPQSIRRYDTRRCVTIRAQLQPGALADDARAALARSLRAAAGGGPAFAPSDPRNGVPGNGETPSRAHPTDAARTSDPSLILADEEIRVEFGGENTLRDEAFADLEVAMAIALAAILVIMVAQFNSLVQPLIVLATVPLSLTGVAVGLLLFGYHFSVSSMIGVVALAGVVVDQAIVLLDFTNRLRASGLSWRESVVFAGQLRLRAILLTTGTTILGLLPMCIDLSGGNEFFQPLAVTLAAGLTVATFLQLVVVPLACYELLGRSEHRAERVHAHPPVGRWTVGTAVRHASASASVSATASPSPPTG